MYSSDVLATVQTLDNDAVEEISPKRSSNPDNVRRVEFILSEENFEDLFPRRHRSYTYTRLLQVRIRQEVNGNIFSHENNSRIANVHSFVYLLAIRFVHIGPFCPSTTNYHAHNSSYPSTIDHYAFQISHLVCFRDFKAFQLV